LKQMK